MVEGVVFPMETQSKRYRLAFVLTILGAAVALLILARGALFPFMLSGAVAYILFPLVRLIEKRVLVYKRWEGSKRLISVTTIFLVTIGVIVGVLALLIPRAVEEGSRFADSIPELIDDARATLERWSGDLDDRIPPEIRDEFQTRLEGVGDVLLGAITSIATRTVGTAANVLTVVFGMVAVPFLVFYLLKDGDQAITAMSRGLPQPARRHTSSVLSIAHRIFSSYLRAQLLLALFVVVLVFVGLTALGIPNAVPLALLAGAFEFVPVIGPLLGLIPGVLVTLAVAPQNVIWVILLYAGIQAVQGTLVGPRVQGKAVDLHPALIMLVVVVASETAGLLGVVVAVPLAAVARDIFKYFYAEWTTGEVVEDEVELEEAVEPEPAG
jgi:predicted PurR-regulated permease PerM